MEIIPKEFALRWSIPESSIYKAIAQLKKLGLILIKSGRLLIEWITKSDSELSAPAKIIGSEAEFSDPAKDSQIRQKFSDPAKDSQIRQTILRSENEFSDPRINSQIRPNQQPERLKNKESSSLQTLQTVQTIHTSQTTESVKIQKTTNVIKEEVASTEVLLAEEINNNSSFGKEKLSFTKENNSSGRSIVVIESNQNGASSTIFGQKPYSPQEINWRWLPDGPWNVEGKLERNFQEWLAKKWVAKYGDDIYEAKANVLSYFRNDPAKLPIKWEQYHSEFQARFENIDTRLKNGITVSPEQRLNAIANARAVLPMSEEQQPTTKQLPVTSHQSPVNGEKLVTGDCSLVTEMTDPWQEAAAAEAEVIAEAATTKTEEIIETYVTDEDGRRYKDVTGIAARQEKEISEEERKTVAAKLSEFISGLSQKMKIKSQPQPAEPKNELENLNEMLLDPVFRQDSEILGKVKKYLCDGYLADYDDAGYPISVYAF